MERSQELYGELRKLEGTLSDIEEAENKALSDPALRELVTQLEMSKVVFEVNDQRTKDLQQELNIRVSAIRSGRRGYLKQFGEITNQLSSITAPDIRGYVEELSDLGQRPKLSREILDKRYEGFAQKTILTVMTNEKRILRIRNLVKKGIEKIQEMRLSPISEIRAEFSRIKVEIDGVDWHVKDRIAGVDEAEFFKFSFPQTIDPNFRGPLTGLPG